MLRDSQPSQFVFAQKPDPKDSGKIVSLKSKVGDFDESGGLKGKQMTWHVVKLVWWLVLGALPMAMWDIAKSLRSAIGCPPGDCYLPGSASIGGIEFIALAMMVFVWPVCLCYLAGNGLLLVRHIRGDQDSGEQADADLSRR